jgi:predicted metalloprotease
MKWNRGSRSGNLEDMRGASGGGGGFRGGGARLGLGGMVVLLILSLVFKKDFFSLVGGGGGMSTEQPAAGPVQSTPQEEEQVDFVSAVLDSTQRFWAQEFPRQGAQYQAANLVLFRDAIQSACGFAESATGPFYCPGDQKVYIDLGFYAELKQRFGAPGDFAQAYVLAHEIGHHVQNLLGISGQVQQMRQSMSKRDGNALSVRTELQADCFAGVWANRADRQRGGKMIDDKDVEQAMAAATAIGDDKLQRQTQGRVVPDSFTHGSSAQRTRWFRIGLDSGDYRKCDTFRAQQL